MKKVKNVVISLFLLQVWLDVSDDMIDGEYENIDYRKCKDIVDHIIMYIVSVQLKIKERLKELSEL